MGVGWRWRVCGGGLKVRWKVCWRWGEGEVEIV